MWSSSHQPGGKPVVGHVADSYVVLSQNWIHTQAKHVAGWQSFILTDQTRNLHLLDDVPNHFARWEHLPSLARKADSGLGKALGFYPSKYALAKWNRVRILHTHFGPTGHAALPLARALDVPLVTTFYGYDVSSLPREEAQWTARYQRLFAEGDLFLVEGPALGRQLSDLGCPDEKIRVQRLGIETGTYHWERRRKDPEEPLRVLMVGRFAEKKGFPDGLQAFSRFIEHGGNGRVTIIGGGDTPGANAIRQTLQDIAQTNGLQDHVDFRGFVEPDELREAYRNHHVLLSPSVEAESGDNEGGAPVTLIEAQATGLPVVSTYHRDIPEVVRDGETGLLAPEHDSDELARHLRRLSEQPQLIEEMGQSARTHIEEKFDAERQGEELGKHYDRVVGDHSGS